jgi:hypothetical protein
VRPAVSAATLASLTFMLAASGCHHTDEGPAQRAGEKVDNAGQDVKDSAKDAAHDVKKDVKDK